MATLALEKKTLIGIEKGTGNSFAAVVSTSVIDMDGDIIEPSAFTAGTVVPLLVGHRWDQLPVGKGRIDPGTSEVKMQAEFFETSAGREAAETLKSLGPLAQFSVGFTVQDYEFRDIGGRNVRVIKAIKLHEVSLVVAGSNPGTRLLDSRQSTVQAELSRFLAFDRSRANPPAIPADLRAIRDRSRVLGVPC